jgi:hypothetical protein
MSAAADFTIAEVSTEELGADLPGFGGLLHACVLAGASVGFVLPFGEAEAVGFWERKILPAVRENRVLLLAARSAGRLVGTVQLDHDMPPNQPHRAEVRKLLVGPAHRRQGIARALMGEIERRARNLGRSLLTLDTRTGDKAEPLYTALGFTVAGIIPDYCRDTLSDRLDPTTIMYKRI